MCDRLYPDLPVRILSTRCTRFFLIVLGSVKNGMEEKRIEKYKFIFNNPPLCADAVLQMIILNTKMAGAKEKTERFKLFAERKMTGSRRGLNAIIKERATGRRYNSMSHYIDTTVKITAHTVRKDKVEMHYRLDFSLHFRQKIGVIHETVNSSHCVQIINKIKLEMNCD